MFADVIVDLASSEVDKIFEYSFNDDDITLGSRVVVPFGRNHIEGIVIGIHETPTFDPQKIKPITRLLEKTPALTKETLKLCEYVAKTCYVPKALALRLFLPSEMRKGKVKEQFTKVSELASGLELETAVNSLKKTAVKQKEALLFLQENGKTPNSRLNLLFGNSAIKSLIEKGYLVVTEEKYFRSPYKDLQFNGKSVVLTEKQQNAVLSVQNTEKTVSLIHGVTGSGKTEVYLKLIEETIKKGKSVIFLVPEIALTPQMLKQLRARFSENAAILHSGLSSGERFDEWWRLRNGDAKIAIGARSAIFAPVTDLGLIILDEEHDGSYSSESSPRYQTIDLATFRAKLNGAKLVLGSATPSVESYRRAIIGDYNLIELPDRINKKPMPEIEIVDMRAEIKRGNNSPFSRALISELEDCLNNGNQAMIFLNQRGFSKSVVCTECGHVLKCDQCDVSLTYHREDDSLLCHYCGNKYKMITSCPECGSKRLKFGAFGTERIVDELSKLFPNAKILRMDRDTTQNKEGHFKILNEFSNKNADILVGTQMIAKGHDFASVTLVGIIDADAGLYFSDYRSAERTFQLLTQVAGRSGRADQAGKVVLQTYSPNNEVLALAVNYNYKSFYKREISLRSATGFPPFTKIVRVLISATDEDHALAVTKAVYEETYEIYQRNKDKFRFFGCMKAPLKRLQNKYRLQVLCRVDDDKIIDEFAKIANKYDDRTASVYIEINPNNLT